MPLTPRHLNRYRQIAEVLTRHGYGAILAQLDLDPRLAFPRRLLLRPKHAPEFTPAQHMRLAFEELGPTFVKVGQLLSTRADLLPPNYLNELSRLQNQVAATSWDKIKPVIESELETPVTELFLYLNPEPLAAASLAQVYAAILPNGREVVVKVQRPGIEDIIELDLDILYDLAHLAQERTPLGDYYNLVDLVDEFALFLRGELDYRREGQNADRFRNNFAGEKKLYVPEVYWEYTSRRVMIQERIGGIKISDVDALDTAGYDRHRLALYSARFIVKQVLQDGFFHADPHPGNIIVMPGEVLGVLDYGTMGTIPARLQVDLIRLYIAAIQLDVESFVDQLVRMDLADHRFNRRELRKDLRRLLLKYHGLPLKDIRAYEVLEDIQPIFYRHRLNLPSDLWLLTKALVIMEGVGLRLDPNFDIFAVSGPYVRQFLLQLWRPDAWGPSVVRSANSWMDLIGNFPRQTSRIMSQIEEGELTVQLTTPQLESVVGRLGRIANRVIVSVLLAAFILGLSILIPSFDLTWPWSFAAWFVNLTFGVVTVLGLWLIYTILRSGGGV